MTNPLDWQQQAIRRILIEACVRLSGSIENNDAYTKLHVWRDAMYTGFVHGSPVVWKGWSTSLGSGYKTTYIDVVPDILDDRQKQRLYGDEMCLTIGQTSEFIIAFVTGFKEKHISLIRDAGFKVRIAGTNAVHAFFIIDPELIHSENTSFIVEKTVELILLGRSLLLESNDRR